MTTRWPSRIAAFLLWALAALSATYWLLTVIGASETPVSAAPLGTPTAAVDVQDLARALGPATTPSTGPVAATPQVPAQDPGKRMQLLGVVSGRTSGGVALISIEGQLPRPYRVGSAVDTDYRLSRVDRRSATLSPTQPDGRAITLELPETVADNTQQPLLPGTGATNRLPGSLPGRPNPVSAAPANGAPANNAVGTSATDTDEPAKD